MNSYTRLEAVRGASALAVLLGHANQIFFIRLPSTGNAQALLGGILAGHAVIIFFLLSGYLITKSICSNIERHNGRFDVLEYATSRIARIYPPLIGAVAIALLVEAIIHLSNLPGGSIPYGLPGDVYRARSEFTITLSEIFSALTMSGGFSNANSPLWSLYVEFQIYFLAMVAAAWWRNGGWFGFLLLLLGTLLLLMLLPNYFLFVSVWLVGCGLALWRVPKSVGYFVAIGGITFIGVLATFRLELLSDWANTRGVFIYFLCSLTYAALLFVVPPRVAYPQALVRSGAFSYSLYVIHWPLLMLALSLSQNWIQHSAVKTWFVAAGALAIIIPSAILCGKIFEAKDFYKAYLLQWWKPISSINDRLADRLLLCRRNVIRNGPGQRTIER